MIEAIEIINKIKSQFIKAKDLKLGQYYWKDGARLGIAEHISMDKGRIRFQSDYDAEDEIYRSSSWFDPDAEIEVIAKCALKTNI